MKVFTTYEAAREFAQSEANAIGIGHGILAAREFGRRVFQVFMLPAADKCFGVDARAERVNPEMNNATLAALRSLANTVTSTDEIQYATVRPNDRKGETSTDWDVFICAVPTHMGVYARDKAGWFFIPTTFASLRESIETGVFSDAVISGMRSVPRQSVPEIALLLGR